MKTCNSVIEYTPTSAELKEIDSKCNKCIAILKNMSHEKIAFALGSLIHSFENTYGLKVHIITQEEKDRRLIIPEKEMINS